MTNRLNRRVLSLFVLFFSLFNFQLAQAQVQPPKDFPNKALRIIVPYPAGGTTDILARIIGNDLSTEWKVPVLVENKTGASGIIGNDLVAKSAPDGYTLLMGITTLLQGPHMFPSIPYDFKRDLIPLALVALSSHVLMVSSKFPANTFEDFIAQVKANPGKYSYGSYGAGTTSHIHGETLKFQSGLDMIHVPYKGGSPLMTDLVGGQVDAAFVDIGNVKPFMGSDKIKMLAVTGEQRMKILPNLRTLTEMGYKDFEPYPFFAFYLPAGTPPAIVTKLANEMHKSITSEANEKKIEELGLIVSGLTGTEFQKIVDRDYEMWGNVIRSGKIKLEQ
jgi:tripartite-type tricarboxylate transporter receptor subunit TctC